MQDNQRQGLHALSYIGGLIDGEGSIMITRSCCGYGRRTPSYTPRIKISMTDIEPLEFVVKETGFGKINCEVERNEKDGCIRKPIYMWQIHSIEKPLEFATMILPYLIIKAPQCRLLIDYCSKFTKQRKCMDGVPDDVRKYREDVYEQIHKLNMRNRPQRLSPRTPEKVKR